MKIGVAIITLGCKLNQLESEAIAESFSTAGFPPAQKLPAPGPGIIIINTCTVTSKADQKCRRVIRKALRENPDSCVIVTGCYAQLDHDELQSLDEGTGRLLVLAAGSLFAGTAFAGTAKSALLELPEYLVHAAPDESLADILKSWIKESRAGQPFDFKPEAFAFHSRGYLKIQDGCDNSCAYCRVRLARGPSVSLPHESALEQLRSCEARGLPELMITGVNITQYQHDGFDLAGLLEYLLTNSSAIPLRLSSLEPERIDQRLAAVAAHPRIRPHFHLSVQSGSDAVLRRMGRAYTAHTVEQAAALLRSVKDNPFLACDIIAGFPGESEAAFNETLALCEKIGFAWIHAFPYSPRPGTPAFSYKEAVGDKEITRRVEELASLTRQLRRDYAQAWLGRELSAVVEKGACNEEHCRAVSENYLKLLVKCTEKAAGSVLRCVPVSLCEGADGEEPDAIAIFAK